MDKVRVGVALSGGTAKTIAHIGVLEALEDAGIQVSCVAGTSGGCLVTNAENSMAGDPESLWRPRRNGLPVLDVSR